MGGMQKGAELQGTAALLRGVLRPVGQPRVGDGCKSICTYVAVVAAAQHSG